MADFKELYATIKPEIDRMNQEIVQKIKNGLFEGVNEMLTHRYDLLTQLVSSVSTQADKAIIVPYLNIFQQSDQILVALVNKSRDQIAERIQNLNNITKYTIV